MSLAASFVILAHFPLLRGAQKAFKLDGFDDAEATAMACLSLGLMWAVAWFVSWVTQ